MSIKIKVLGCGSAIPLLGRRPTSQYIQIDQFEVLLDCGEGTQIQLRKMGVRFQNIHAICITHLHGDHYLGLPGLLQTLHMLGRRKPLVLVGPVGTWEMLGLHLNIGNTNLNYPVEFICTQSEKPEIVWETPLFTIKSIPLKHKIPTTGFFIEEKIKPRKLIVEKVQFYEVPHYLRNAIKQGADFEMEDGRVIENAKLTRDPLPSFNYFFCTDTAFFPDLKNHLPTGISLLYHESSFLEEDKEKAEATRHSTAKQAGSMAKILEVKQLLLGHYSARYKRTDKHLEEAKTEFENTTLSFDGYEIELN
ncbi:MAG: ribonuclease Z [Sphingobacteriales bacterium]